MLSPRLTDCIECSSISSLLASIDCKLAELSKNLYNNTIFSLNKPIDGSKMSDLLNYKRILMYKLCNEDYASCFSLEMIASRVRLLVGKGCPNIPIMRRRTTTTTTSRTSSTTTTTSSSSTTSTTSSTTTVASEQIVKVNAGEYSTTYITNLGKVYMTDYNGSAYVPTNFGLSGIVSGYGAQYDSVVLDGSGNVKTVAAGGTIVSYTTTSTLAPFTNVTQVSAIYNPSSFKTSYLGIMAGEVYVFGKDAMNINGGVDIANPIKLTTPAGKTITKIVGCDLGLLALASDGTVWRWNFGSLTATQVVMPGSVTITSITTIGKGVFIAANSTNIFAWGGTFGITEYVGLATGITTPTSIKTNFVSAGAVFPLKEIAGTYNTLHVIDANDNHFACGDNVMGEIGNGQEYSPWKTYYNGTSSNPYQWNFGRAQKLQGTAVQIPGKFKNLSGGSVLAFYMYAQDMNNNWYSWGRNKSRCLGNGLSQNDNDESTYPNAYDVPAPKLVTPLTQSWTITGTGKYGASVFNPATARTPQASAGINQYISGTSTTLYGSASYQQDGTIVSYSWTKLSGPSCTIVSPTLADTSVTGLSIGTYVFQLTVTNNNAATNSSTVTVVVS